MKRKFIQQIINLFIVSLVAVSCSGETEGQDNPGNTVPGDVPVTIRLDTKALPDNLECDLYIFRKSTADEDYILHEIISFGNDDRKSLKFLNNELLNNSYRFFFIAKAAENQEISLLDNADEGLSTGTVWQDVRVIANTESLSTGYYYGILDKTGTQILNDGVIHGVLGRLVGQMTVDIFRIGSDINTVVNKVSPTVASVLDRVYQIDIGYTGLTKTIAFTKEGAIIEKERWDDMYLQKIKPLLGDTLQVYLPQNENSLEISGYTTSGSARIKGLCALPSTKNIRLKLVFHYYDTTPLCGNADGGNHASTCFSTKQLVLNLPQADNAVSLLSILSNNYTVNKAGIRYDRIIDVEVNGLLTFDTVWEINN